MRASVAIATALALAATAATAAEAPIPAGRVGLSAASATPADPSDVAAEAAAEPETPPAPERTPMRHSAAAPRADRAQADAFTERFNRQELDALQSGSGPPGRGGDWHPLYPPR